MIFSSLSHCGRFFPGGVNTLIHTENTPQTDLRSDLELEIEPQNDFGQSTEHQPLQLQILQTVKHKELASHSWSDGLSSVDQTAPGFNTFDNIKPF